MFQPSIGLAAEQRRLCRGALYLVVVRVLLLYTLAELVRLLGQTSMQQVGGEVVTKALKSAVGIWRLTIMRI